MRVWICMPRNSASCTAQPLYPGSIQQVRTTKNFQNAAATLRGFAPLRVLTSVVAGLIGLTMDSIPRAAASEHANPLFGYTHMAPSPFTLKAGRLILGTDIAFGITDFLQIGTNVVRDIFEIYNANGKIAILDADDYAAALTFNYEHYNLQSFSTANPDVVIDAYQPGVTTAYALHEQVAVFGGANLNFTKYRLPTGLDTSGFQRGAEVFSDISFAYNPPSKSPGVGNVLSAGFTYDFTYELLGIGVSHHFPGFHIGIHYYPGASTRPVLPIISGGAVVDL